MDTMKYSTIQVMKKSERSEVVFAAMEGMDVPVVVRRLQGANPEIFRGIAKLSDSHIPQIYCVEEQGEELCVAEEYIDGRTLDAYLAEKTPTDVQKLELCVQLCEALEALHGCKPPVIHRDIKPSNILITGDGVLKVIDFDASRQYKAEKNTSDTRYLGTIEYAAPEQFGYAQTDVRSDVYSVGVVFSEISIAKDLPFSKDWKRVVDKCTSFDPANRYKSVSELKKELLKCIWKAKTSFWRRWAESIRQITKKDEPASEGETGIVGKQKALKGERTELVGYRMDEMEYRESRGVSHRLNSNNSVSLKFDRMYAGIDFELKDVIDMKYCDELVVYMKNKVGELAIILYDEEFRSVETLYQKKTEKIGEMRFSPKYNGKVEYIGFMASDGELEDYSGYESVIYYVDFYVVNSESERVSYKMGEFTEEAYEHMERTYNEDGSLFMDFEKIYSEMVLALPKPVDLRYCNGIGLVMDSASEFALKLYDEKRKEIDLFVDRKTKGVEEKLFIPTVRTKVYGIGLMANDSEVTDYTDCHATVYEMNFYMEEGHTGEA